MELLLFPTIILQLDMRQLMLQKNELTYLFVNPLFRRQGYGTLLLTQAEKAAGSLLKLAEPISPLGRKFFSRNNHG
jgi:GNAT superfamily N-acetyltransferase